MGGAFGNVVGEIIKSGAGILDKFVDGKGDIAEREHALKMFEAELISKLNQASIEAEVKIRSEVEKTIRSEMEAKAAVMEAELKQDDKYVKRARPTIIYSYPLMLIMLLIASIAFSAFGIDFEIPSEVEGVLQSFSLAWGGVSGTYVIGRSREKINDSSNNPSSSSSVSSIVSSIFNKGR